MVRFGLSENLQAIAAGGSLSDVGFALLRWAEAQGRLDELVRQAQAQNPGNRELQIVAAWFGPATVGAQPAPVMPGAIQPAHAQPNQAPADRVAIRNALREHFNAEGLRDLCFSLGVDYEDLQGETRSAKTLSLVEYMEHRVQTERLVDAIRAARGTVL